MIFNNMKRYFIVVITFFSILSSSKSQTGINLLDHDIDHPPQIFGRQVSQKSNKTFRDIINADTTINGVDVKIRTYSINAIHSTLRVMCYYFSHDGQWRCQMARFFSNYQPTPNGIGYIGPNTAGSVTVLLNLTQSNDNVSEFKNFNGVVLTGDPPWASWLNPTKEWVFVTKLDAGEVNSPADGINRAVAFMNGNSLPKSNPSSEVKKSVYGFFGLYYE
jgi:hypothetical protein